MKDSISLSEKHGLNPSLVVCPICGKSHSIALFGKLPNDKEAPKTIAGEICNDCINKLNENEIYILAINENHLICKYAIINKSHIKIKIKDRVVLMHESEFNNVFNK